MHGFKWALANNYGYTSKSCRFSHNPNDLPLIPALADGADLAI